MKFIKSFSIYTFSSFFNKGIAFLLLPVFTNYLTPHDYGLVSLYSTANAVLLIFLMAGTDGAIRKKFFDLKGDFFRDYFATAVVVPIIFLSISYVLVVPFVSYLTEVLGVSKFWIFLLPLMTFFGVLFQIQTGVFRIQEKAQSFAVFNISQLLFTIALSILLVVYFSMGYEGRLYGMLVGTIVFGIIAAFLFHKSGYIPGKVNKVDFKHVLHYGLPLIPHHIGAFIVNSSDRFFISELVGKEELGLYSVGYTIGSITMLFQDAFVNAFIPLQFRELKDNGNQVTTKIRKVIIYFVVALFGTVLVLTAFSDLIFDWFISPAFAEGKKYVFWISLSYFFLGCYKVYAGYIFYFEKTKWLSYMAVGNIGINLLLNYFLISQFGAIGAAYATCISFFMLFAFTVFITRRLVKQRVR